MNRLPYETLIDIFSRLNSKDKLQCALTCRDWHTKISNTVLYSTIHFKYFQSDTQTKTFIKYIHDKNIGRQVKELRTSSIGGLLELSELCPNLKSLQLDEWEHDEWDDSNNASLAKNWKKLEHINEEGCFLTRRLLESSCHMMSLTFLEICLEEQTKEASTKFFKLLNHAPVLNYLTLNWAVNLDYKMLDILHENAPNLKHLELRDANYDIAGEGYDLEEHRQLPITSVANNLRSISITLHIAQNVNDWEICSVYWIEYICRKYPKLTSVAIPTMNVLPSQHKDKMLTNFVKRAFCNWTQLKKFDVRSVYLSKDILQAMDDNQIRLNELKIYITKAADMKQFSSLAESNQRNTIYELIMDDTTGEWISQEHLVYFLKSLNKDECQLKAIDIRANSRMVSSKADSDALSPNQVLDYIPSLQHLTMRWIGTKEQVHTTLDQTTLLKSLNLELYHLTYECNSLQHIQDIIQRSPSLQSLSIYLFTKDITFDFRQNPKFTHLICFHKPGDIIKVVQNNQISWYTRRLAEYEPTEEYVRGQPENDDDNEYRVVITLYMPSTAQSLYINDSLKIQF
jgi:hypothetical protein